ncbi:hypothetical protein CFO_g5039 [Ceratocystis platani]|uniref:Uncharacterized protein n=1 Tax=Ceratocystis fimbriata f. sp. platani TaxID=88771 RepID=A0A0F8B009_CERFI|nr:hypothetical protein CFO_g5039 [Ceratocystis platani]
MRPSLTSLCLSLPCLDICGSLSSPNVQPTHRVAPGPTEAIALPKATHPSDPYYLESHGYGYEELTSGSFGIYNERDDPEYPELLVDVRIDTSHKVTTIRESVLHLEGPHKDRLELPQLFQALCYQQDIRFEEMKWVVMDIDDTATRSAVRAFRKNNNLNSNEEVRLTPNDQAWEIFSKTPYYKDAAKMVPGSEIDRILFRTQNRKIKSTDFPNMIYHIVMFSFKNLTPGNENTPVSLIDKQAAELAAERDLNAAIEDSGNARQAELEAILKTNSEGCSSTSSRESGGESSLETAPGPISESI